jgi:hypothetical protein
MSCRYNFVQVDPVNTIMVVILLLDNISSVLIHI